MAIEPSICRAPALEPVRWWVAQTRPQDEQRVVDAVNAVGGYALSPREIVRKSYPDKEGRRQAKEWTRPIFPQYVFYSGDRDSIFEARQIIRVFDTNERDWREIGNFILAYESVPVRRCERPRLRNGTRVKVVSGPAQGVEGEIERFGDMTVLLICRLGIAEIDLNLNEIEPFFGD